METKVNSNEYSVYHNNCKWHFNSVKPSNYQFSLLCGLANMRKFCFLTQRTKKDLNFYIQWQQQNWEKNNLLWLKSSEWCSEKLLQLNPSFPSRTKVQEQSIYKYKQRPQFYRECTHWNLYLQQAYSCFKLCLFVGSGPRLNSKKKKKTSKKLNQCWGRPNIISKPDKKEINITCNIV